MSLLIRNVQLVLEEGILWDGALLVREGRIAALGREEELPCPADAELLDGEGLYLGPGFVDIHVHGGGGHLFYQEPEQAAEHFLAHGETTILPALYFYLGPEEYVEAIRRIRSAAGSGGAGRVIAGVYMEGPYLNPKYGADPEKNQWLGPVDPEKYRPVVDCAGSFARMWAVAPEREGVAEFMRYVRSVDPAARFSVAHSEADFAQMAEAKALGANQLTHCMDATGRRSDWEGTRGCGPDEYCLLDREMYAELISDSRGIHVSSALQRLILQSKGPDRVVLITDSSVRRHPAPKGLETVTDLSFDPKGRLGGSLLTMDQACRNLMHHTNCGIAQAFLLASRNPARAVGLEDRGTLAPGKRADLVLTDDRFRVKRVFLEGKTAAIDETLV